MNINSEQWFSAFDISKVTVGQIGHGYIGQAVESLFKHMCRVLVYDKAKSLNTLEEVVGESHVIFVAVPTPMNADGSCHTGIVESVLQDIQNTALKIGRDVEDFVVVIKSTVPPGFTARMQDRFALRVMFSPEFLTEKNSINDFRNATRLVLGGDEEDRNVVYKLFEAVWINRLPANYIDHPAGPVNIIGCQPIQAELCKYFCNCYLATVVMFANEFKLLCEALKVDYDIVKMLALLDTRVSPSHLDVPGHDGRRGFGGSCFPKDINSIRHVCRENGVAERLFSAVIKRNEEIRPERDWEELKGRAVV
jgi:UDPglucose 6-dehydrogenase